jgi:outer membrane protein
MARVIAFSIVVVLFANCALAQTVPVSPDRPWHSPEERQAADEGRQLPRTQLPIDPDKAYPLAELIDLAESHNPETRVAWENALAQAAALGIARSELYPLVSAVALAGVER